jgi:hypothetical protein
MIRNAGGRIVIECDSCDDEFEGERGEPWPELWPRAKEEGWKARKVGRDFLHGCPRHEV